MKPDLLKRVRTTRRLDAAWRSVRSNTLSSKAKNARKNQQGNDEIARFEQDPSGNIASLQYRLSRGQFRFSPARGVAIPKPGKKDIRPLVIASLEDRIVQRALLDVLQDVKPLRPYFRNPYSFGGIKKGQDDELAAVPAAISAILKAIEGGARFVFCADISAFFTRISKLSVTNIVASAIPDPNFIEFFEAAVHVELSNLENLRQHANRFPTGDIGVAQGSSLSPLLGNIALSDFDNIMNEGDCRCIRYIDDFIIMAPSRKAAKSRFRVAQRLLAGLNMECAPGKTWDQPISIDERFEFLGIELHNGLIRPAPSAQQRLLDKLRSIFDESRSAFLQYRHSQTLHKSESLLSTLKRIDGVIQGWGKHYRFCNDIKSFENLDLAVSRMIGEYLGIYRSVRNEVAEKDRPAMLGVEMLGSINLNPLFWPQRVPRPQRSSLIAHTHSQAPKA